MLTRLRLNLRARRTPFGPALVIGTMARIKRGGSAIEKIWMVDLGAAVRRVKMLVKVASGCGCGRSRGYFGRIGEIIEANGVDEWRIEHGKSIIRSMDWRGILSGGRAASGTGLPDAACGFRRAACEHVDNPSASLRDAPALPTCSQLQHQGKEVLMYCSV